MKLLIASDHAGFQLKEQLKKKFSHVEWMDLGCHSEDSVDYPDYADSLAQQLKSLNDAKGLSHSKDLNDAENSEAPSQSKGVLICGSGQGMAMTANKSPHIRAALCWDEESARLSRQHNDANILCLSGRLLPPLYVKKSYRSF